MPSPPIRSGELEGLWARVDHETIARAAGSAEEAERLRLQLLDRTFSHFADLSEREQAQTAAVVHAFAARLAEPLEGPQRQLERAWVRRLQLLLVAIAVLIGLWFLIARLNEWRELRTDMAPSASWKASSEYSPEYTCISPAQTCENSPNLFFHTGEEKNPSIVFDLGRERQLSAVWVENRRDCCSERALPLIVQVSSDNRHWKAIATRSAPFSIWHEHFPTVQARWVKLYVPRRDLLHLARVRLIP